MSKDSGQSPDDEGTQEQPESIPTVEIDGKQVTLDELKAGYMRQSDYTKKTQELSKMKKQDDSEPDDQGDFDKNLDVLADALASRFETRFASKKDQDLEDFLRANPDLEGKRKLLTDLAKGTDKSYWDLADEYQLKDSDALGKSKSRKLVGERKAEPKPQKRISDLSPEEYAQWKKENLGKSEQWVAKKMI